MDDRGKVFRLGRVLRLGSATAHDPTHRELRLGGQTFIVEPLSRERLRSEKIDRGNAESNFATE